MGTTPDILATISYTACSHALILNETLETTKLGHHGHRRDQLQLGA
jgi:hypothetical protein